MLLLTVGGDRLLLTKKPQCVIIAKILMALTSIIIPYLALSPFQVTQSGSKAALSHFNI